MLESQKMGTLYSWALLVICTLSIGCARVEVFKDVDLEDRIGIPVYRPVPHLLVTRSEGKVETQVIVLPDRSDPFYVVPRAGLGTVNAQFALANGVMTNFQGSSDSKIPELVNAVANLAKEAAGAFTGVLGALRPPEAPIEDQAVSTESANAAVPLLNRAQVVLAGIAQNTDLADTNWGTVKVGAMEVASAVGIIKSELNDATIRLNLDPDVVYQRIQAQKRLVDGLHDALEFSEESTEPERAMKASFRIASVGLEATAKLFEKKSAPTTFELYRIGTDESGKTTLTRVQD